MALFAEDKVRPQCGESEVSLMPDPLVNRANLYLRLLDQQQGPTRSNFNPQVNAFSELCSFRTCYSTRQQKDWSNRWLGKTLERVYV